MTTYIITVEPQTVEGPDDGLDKESIAQWLGERIMEGSINIKIMPEKSNG